MSNQNSPPPSQYSGLNAPLIFPSKPAGTPTAAEILGKKPPVLPVETVIQPVIAPVVVEPVVIAPPIVVAPVIQAPVVEKILTEKPIIQPRKFLIIRRLPSNLRQAMKNQVVFLVE